MCTPLTKHRPQLIATLVSAVPPVEVDGKPAARLGVQRQQHESRRTAESSEAVRILIPPPDESLAASRFLGACEPRQA